MTTLEEFLKNPELYQEQETTYKIQMKAERGGLTTVDGINYDWIDVKFYADSSAITKQNSAKSLADSGVSFNNLRQEEAEKLLEEMPRLSLSLTFQFRYVPEGE